MRYRILGRTGLRVSEIGLGGIPIQEIGHDEAVSIIKKCKALGVNFIDTGIAYTNSEAKIGAAIKGDRAYWIIADKSPAISYSQMKKDIDKSLENLGTDYIDLYQIHHVKSPEMLKRALGASGAYKALAEAQKAGKIKSIGITSHDNPVLLQAAKSGKFDTVLVSFNILERDAEKQLLPYCAENNIGVIVMKPLAGGTIKHASEAIRFCLSVPGISCVIPGVHLEKELEEDIAKVVRQPEFTKEDCEAIRPEIEERAKGTFCRGCGYCTVEKETPVCPVRISTFYFFRLDGYAQKFGIQPWMIEQYAEQPTNPSDCIFCGQCEAHCPYGLPIRRAHRDLLVRAAFEKSGKQRAPRDTERKRDFFGEMAELDTVAKANLGSRWEAPVPMFNYPRGSNKGQQATVRKLIVQLEEEQKRFGQLLFEDLCHDMKIKPEGLKSLNDVVALSNYDNIVDAMRHLPVAIDAMRQLNANLENILHDKKKRSFTKK